MVVEDGGSKLESELGWEGFLVLFVKKAWRDGWLLIDWRLFYI